MIITILKILAAVAASFVDVVGGGRRIIPRHEHDGVSSLTYGKVRRAAAAIHGAGTKVRFWRDGSGHILPPPPYREEEALYSFENEFQLRRLLPSLGVMTLMQWRRVRGDGYPTADASIGWAVLPPNESDEWAVRLEIGDLSNPENDGLRLDLDARTVSDVVAFLEKPDGMVHLKSKNMHLCLSLTGSDVFILRFAPTGLHWGSHVSPAVARYIGTTIRSVMAGGGGCRVNQAVGLTLQ